MVALAVVIHESGSGLCNQIFSLIWGIIYARQNEYDTVVVDTFSTNFDGSMLLPSGTVFDFVQMSEKLGNCPRLVCKSEWSDPVNGQYRFFHWPTIQNFREQFDELLRAVVFHPRLLQIAQSYADLIKTHAHVDAIHLRVEQDAITHYSSHLRIDPQIYQQMLVQKYLTLIDKYLDPSHAVFVLGFGENDEVLKHLLNHYTTENVFLLPKKVDNGREISAVIDFLVCELVCNGTFIGAFNMTRLLGPYNLTGSSFSYTLVTRMHKNSVRKIGLALELLEEPETVVNNETV